MATTVTRTVVDGVIATVSVTDSVGVTSGIDFDVTVTLVDGSSATLSINSGSAAYGTLTDATPTGVAAILLSSRVPSDSSQALDSVVVQVASIDGPSSTTTPTQEPGGSVALGLVRSGGVFVWQSAPVILPALLEGPVTASNVESSAVTEAYTGGTSRPADDERFWAVLFEAGTTPAGTVLHVQSWQFELSSSGIGMEFYGRNTAPGSTAVSLAVMPGNSANNFPQIKGAIVITSPTSRSGWIDHTNSGVNGVGASVVNTSTNLNTDDEWELFLVSDNGAGSYVSNGVTVEILQQQTADGVTLFRPSP